MYIVIVILSYVSSPLDSPLLVHDYVVSISNLIPIWYCYLLAYCFVMLLACIANNQCNCKLGLGYFINLAHVFCKQIYYPFAKLLSILIPVQIQPHEIFYNSTFVSILVGVFLPTIASHTSRAKHWAIHPPPYEDCQSYQLSNVR